MELGSFECKTLGAGHKASVDQAFLKIRLLDDSAGQLQFERERVRYINSANHCRDWTAAQPADHPML